MRPPTVGRRPTASITTHGGGWEAWVFRAPGDTLYQWMVGRAWHGVVAIGKAASWQKARSEAQTTLREAPEPEGAPEP